MITSVRRVETTSRPEIVRFRQTVRAVQAYVRDEPGAHSDLMSSTRRDPEAMTASLVSLAIVLLDLAAGAFHLTPDEVLEKVAVQVADDADLPVR